MLLSKLTEKALLTSFNDHKEQVYSTCLIRCTGGATHGKK